MPDSARLLTLGMWIIVFSFLYLGSFGFSSSSPAGVIFLPVALATGLNIHKPKGQRAAYLVGEGTQPSQLS